MELSTTIQDVDRSLFEVIRNICVTSGYLPDRLLLDSSGDRVYPDTLIGHQDFEQACNDIASVKGFFVPVFGVSAVFDKYSKTYPRIVIKSGGNLPGDLGADTNYTYEENSDGQFEQFAPPSFSKLTYNIYLASKNIEEERVLRAILSLALPKRHYIHYYNNPAKRFFCENLGSFDVSMLDPGITEYVFRYVVPDIIDQLPIKTGEVAAPLSELKIDGLINATPIEII